MISALICGNTSSCQINTPLCNISGQSTDFWAQDILGVGPSDTSSRRNFIYGDYASFIVSTFDCWRRTFSTINEPGLFQLCTVLRFAVYLSRRTLFYRTLLRQEYMYVALLQKSDLLFFRIFCILSSNESSYITNVFLRLQSTH